MHEVCSQHAVLGAGCGQRTLGARELALIDIIIVMLGGAGTCRCRLCVGVGLASSYTWLNGSLCNAMPAGVRLLWLRLWAGVLLHRRFTAAGCRRDMAAPSVYLSGCMRWRAHQGTGGGVQICPGGKRPILFGRCCWVGGQEGLC